MQLIQLKQSQLPFTGCQLSRFCGPLALWELQAILQSIIEDFSYFLLPLFKSFSWALRFILTFVEDWLLSLSRGHFQQLLTP